MNFQYLSTTFTISLGIDSNCDPLNSSRSTLAQCKPRSWPSHWVRSHPVCKYDSRKWVRSIDHRHLRTSYKEQMSCQVQHQQCIISDELSIPQHHLHDLSGVDSNCDPLNSSRSTLAQCKPRSWPSHWVRSHLVCKYDSRKWVRSIDHRHLRTSYKEQMSCEVQHQQCIISDELSIPQHHLHDLSGVDSNCDPLNSSRSTLAQCKPRSWPSHWVRSHLVCKYDSRKWVRSIECQNLGSGSNWLQFLYTIHHGAYSFNARKGAHLDSQISIKLFFLLAANDMEPINISSAVTSPI